MKMHKYINIIIHFSYRVFDNKKVDSKKTEQFFIIDTSLTENSMALIYIGCYYFP